MPNTLTVVPVSGQTLNDSRDPIANNFATIGTAFNIDHANFNQANQGMHAKITFPIGTAPAALGAGFIGLYGEADAAGKAQIYINDPLVASADQIPLTGGVKANPGWCYLPCGAIMKWGSGIIGNHTTVTAAFANGLGIPVFSASPVVTVTLQTTDTSPRNIIYITALTAASVTMYNTNNIGGATYSYHYIAIGY